MISKPSGESSEVSEVIVVGAGGCGLAAALAAARRGSRVLLLEKTNAPGGNAALTTAVIAAGSRFQHEAGIEDSPAKETEDILRRNGGQSDIGLTEHLAQRSAAVVEWLSDIAGVEFEVIVMPFGHGTPRQHTCGGGWALIRHLIAAVDHHENIRILWSTPVVSLKLDANGAVTGVVTERGAITGRKIILATGGFGASHELLSQYAPKAADIPHHGHRGNTGDGLHMGIAAGGATANLGGLLPYPSYFAPLHFPVPQVLVHLGGILVDEHGGRFSDETEFPGGPGARMLTLPGKHAYEIFDERIYRSAGNALARVIDARILDKGETAGELARRIGIDPPGLERTIREYNKAAERGKDEFGRTVSAPLTLPLYGVKVWVALYTTQGGLKVNTNSQVLRADGSVIPNLYAGGDVSEGISGPAPGGYLPGNGLMTALGLGKLAGEHAADSLRAGS